MKKIGTIITTIILGALLIMACSQNDSTEFADGNGKINVYLTDAPFPISLVSQTIVTINKVEIRKHENDSTEAIFISLMEEAFEIDLLTLSNGITEQLASVELEAGSYDLIRMHVTDAKVILTDGSEFDLKIPSGTSSGLKIKIQPEITIASGQTTDVLLDFDVSKSFVVKGNWKDGNIKGFNFKPVVRGVLLDRAGRIKGRVTDTTAIALENAAIKLWEEINDVDNDSIVATAFTNPEGQYQLIGIPEGTYYMTAERDSFQTDTIWNVDVLKGESSQIDFVLTPEP
ncbi:DUF4382 domain-containing protein [uncultured Draconibacterium sp.]|uniref:DUF4382 domain-containing protein n=1 Tax=uncultured Draconibacterium sp. TaxID=1573823 RepID=UPI0032607F1F